MERLFANPAPLVSLSVVGAAPGEEFRILSLQLLDGCR